MFTHYIVGLWKPLNGKRKYFFISFECVSESEVSLKHKDFKQNPKSWLENSLHHYFIFEKYTENKYKQFSFQSWNQLLKQFPKNLETLRKLLAIRRPWWFLLRGQRSWFSFATVMPTTFETLMWCRLSICIKLSVSTLKPASSNKI